MTKHLIFPLLPLLLAIALPTASSCQTQNSKKEVTKEFPITEFQSLNVSGNFDVELTQGTEPSLVIYAPDNVINLISVKQTGSTLTIKREAKERFRRHRARVVLSVTTLNELNLSGATNLMGMGLFETPEMTISLSGASDIKSFKVSANKNVLTVSGSSEANCSLTGDLIAKFSGASEGDLDLKGASVLNLEISGSSDVTLKGRARTINATLSGASELDAEGLKLTEADVTLSGASDAELHVDSTLSYSLTGASELKVTGNPQIANASSSRGASFILR